jgi:hypothetical protein
MSRVNFACERCVIWTLPRQGISFEELPWSDEQPGEASQTHDGVSLSLGESTPESVTHILRADK